MVKISTFIEGAFSFSFAVDKLKSKLFHTYLILVPFILFFSIALHKICDVPIQIWDEAVYANNAIEMSEDGDLIVAKNDGTPSVYNVKPTLVIAFQALAIKIFGPNEFAIRLPSILALAACIILILWFSYSQLNDLRVGFLASLILLSSTGFITEHISRTGDLDMVLVFFIIAYTFMIWSCALRGNVLDFKHILLISILVILAYLTKSVAALIPGAGIVIGLLVLGKLKTFLRSPFTYIGVVLFILVVGTYYGYREHLQPGYFQLVFDSEFSRFTKSNMPWHEQGFWYYGKNLINNHFVPYIWVMPIGLLAIYLKPGKNKSSILKLSFIWMLSYFILISIPAVKLEWYLAPFYPIASLFLGITLVELVNRIKLKEKAKNLGFILISITIFFQPIYQTYMRLHLGTDLDPLEWSGASMNDLAKSHPELANYKVWMNAKHNEHYDQARFYSKALKYEGIETQLIHSRDELQPGDTALVCDPALRDSLDLYFKTEVLYELEVGKVYALDSKKTSSP